MTSAIEKTQSAPMDLSRIIKWLPIIIGLLIMYGPTYVTAWQTVWNEADQAHGPLILLITIWLIWKNKDAFSEPSQGNRPLASALGILALAFGGLLYVIGRAMDVFILDIASQIPILTGIVLLTLGMRGLRRLWFPLLFMVFLVPLPGVVVDAITGGLKQYVSIIAEHAIYALGYPIARNGVVLNIGPYQLLVADACSGMHSMYSLLSIGFLYLYMMGYRNKLRIGVLVLSMIPIAFFANIIRVMILILITYHLGDAAGQGFMHGFAGMLLFVVALITLFLLDKLLGIVWPERIGSDKE